MGWARRLSCFISSSYKQRKRSRVLPVGDVSDAFISRYFSIPKFLISIFFFLEKKWCVPLYFPPIFLYPLPLLAGLGLPLPLCFFLDKLAVKSRFPYLSYLLDKAVSYIFVCIFVREYDDYFFLKIIPVTPMEHVIKRVLPLIFIHSWSVKDLLILTWATTRLHSFHAFPFGLPLLGLVSVKVNFWKNPLHHNP